ncbi:MAG: Na(+)-translocating NADH-quinone reductase subunit A [Bacteroidota bacterium]|nr:Na(+)-translocating NADH-quinone reductase subunit A [Bacteroidota bacterium]
MLVKINKGLDIRLKGKPALQLETLEDSGLYAIKPTDFPGLTPKLAVKVDDEVKAGSALFYNKKLPELKFTSPVSGKVVAINRGERRRILEVVVESDGKRESLDFKKGDPKGLSRNEIKETLLSSGLWPFIKQRPFNIIADPEESPRAIFLSAFDSAPLAPDNEFILKDHKVVLQTGIDALSMLTDGKVYVGIRKGTVPESVFTAINGIEINEFDGPHPAGTVGVQIHHISPINKAEIVWVIQPQDILAIGRLFEKGILDTERILSLAGSEVNEPKYYKTILGASVRNMVDGNVNDGNLRFISGNVLTGEKISREGYTGYYDNQVTVIPEGDHHEMFGWIMPRLKKFSTSMSYFSWMMPKKEFVSDTNLNGGQRAFVVSGQYEKVLPMDIYPVELLKAAIIGDIDKMENLGIYEVAEEDMALCEFVCTSKIEVQSILREGFDMMIKELG